MSAKKSEDLSSLKAGWAEYDRKVIPLGASALQREECRRAFYVGAHHLFDILLNATDDDQATIGILRELNGFASYMEVVTAMREAGNVRTKH